MMPRRPWATSWATSTTGGPRSRDERPGQIPGAEGGPGARLAEVPTLCTHPHLPDLGQRDVHHMSFSRTWEPGAPTTSRKRSWQEAKAVRKMGNGRNRRLLSELVPENPVHDSLRKARPCTQGIEGGTYDPFARCEPLVRSQRCLASPKITESEVLHRRNRQVSDDVLRQIAMQNRR
ncbi:MAG: hypothetical protein MZU79_09175 [Anaerotruncus sp.]|nr:hypothetical protein [Anaerotruncus sp.]